MLNRKEGKSLSPQVKEKKPCESMKILLSTITCFHPATPVDKYDETATTETWATNIQFNVCSAV